VRDLLEALWALDLMIAHTHVSVDGTLPGPDLKILDESLDVFCTATQWERDRFEKLVPLRQQQIAMFVDSAESMFSLLDEPLPGVDAQLPAASAKEFFDRLALERDRSLPVADASESRIEELLTLAESGFRGSKCVAAIASCGPLAVSRALAYRDQRPGAEGFAASALINRFRFGYLRHLAWQAGDTYVPGVAWKRLSARNTRTTQEVLANHLGETYVPEIEQELGGKYGMSSTVLPPMALYCLMKANAAHGPRSVIDVASEVASNYREVLCTLTRAEREVTAAFSGWTQVTGNLQADELGLLVERQLTETLGTISTRVARERRGSPSGFHRHKTSLGILWEGAKSLISEATKDTTVASIAKTVPTVAGGALGANAGPVGALVGGVAGAMVQVGGRSVLGAVKRHLRGHIDAYRGLDDYLIAPEVASLHLDKLEEQVQRVLGRKLVA